MFQTVSVRDTSKYTYKTCCIYIYIVYKLLGAIIYICRNILLTFLSSLKPRLHHISESKRHICGNYVHHLYIFQILFLFTTNQCHLINPLKHACKHIFEHSIVYGFMIYANSIINNQEMCHHNYWSASVLVRVFAELRIDWVWMNSSCLINWLFIFSSCI